MSEKNIKTVTAVKRCQQIIEAIDRIAGKNQLAFLTTQRVSKESGISDGVLFRHFPSKEAMLASWVEIRGDQLRLLLEAMPAGRSGFVYLFQHLLMQRPLLNFLCCQAMDTPYLRQELESCRFQFWCGIEVRIALLNSTPEGVSPAVLADHLIQSVYRAWNPDNPDRDIQKEYLMNQLPWEKTSASNDIFPDQETMQRLALNDSGFVFDPVNGRSFTANEIGMYVLRFLQHSNDADALLNAIADDFDVSQADAQRDIIEFSAQLRKFIS